jgi:hypothetical protein
MFYEILDYIIDDVCTLIGNNFQWTFELGKYVFVLELSCNYYCICV